MPFGKELSNSSTRTHTRHLEKIRFLNNAQSAADSANFMKTVRFDGIDEDLTAPGAPWIYYGVSLNPESKYLTIHTQVHVRPT